MKSIITALLVSLTLVGSTAFAAEDKCPGKIQEINSLLLRQTGLEAERKEKAREYQKQGEELHKAGDHKGAVRILNKALDQLGPV